MGKSNTKMVIHSLKGRKSSVVDQVDISHGMWEKGIVPGHEGLKRKEIEPSLSLSLEYTAKTSLGHLVDAGLVERDPHDFDDLTTFVIAEWIGSDGEIVNGEVQQQADQTIDAIIKHMQDADPTAGPSPAVTDGAGKTVRSVLAEAFGVAPEAVESRLRTGDLFENVRTAVPALEEHPETTTRDHYGMLTFRNQAYRYRLSQAAVELYQR